MSDILELFTTILVLLIIVYAVLFFIGFVLPAIGGIAAISLWFTS